MMFLFAQSFHTGCRDLSKAFDQTPFLALILLGLQMQTLSSFWLDGHVGYIILCKMFVE